VGAFLLQPPSLGGNAAPRPSDDELRDWVRADLAWHKAPVHIWWFGDAIVGLDEIPQTGSGKVKKHVLRDVAARLVEEEAVENVFSGVEKRPE
jgi:acyl-CoA synthetase (AMP-forming)/AMP-acid ligase II